MLTVCVFLPLDILAQEQPRWDAMGTAAENTYAFVAFDHYTNALLASGATAVQALREADLVAPDAPIYILNAGPLGAKIWLQRMDLVAAQQAMMSQPLFGAVRAAEEVPRTETGTRVIRAESAGDGPKPV